MRYLRESFQLDPAWGLLCSRRSYNWRKKKSVLWSCSFEPEVRSTLKINFSNKQKRIQFNKKGDNRVRGWSYRVPYLTNQSDSKNEVLGLSRKWKRGIKITWGSMFSSVVLERQQQDAKLTTTHFLQSFWRIDVVSYITLSLAGSSKCDPCAHDSS